MSGGGVEWGGGGTGDTCNFVISITGQDRTDPPDKQRSERDEATSQESRSQPSSPQETERAWLADTTSGDANQHFQQQQKHQQHRYKKYQQYQVKPEKQTSHCQVWIQNQFAQQHTEQREQSTPSSTLTFTGSEDQSTPSSTLIFTGNEGQSISSSTLIFTGNENVSDLTNDVFNKHTNSKQNTETSDTSSKYPETGNLGSLNERGVINNSTETSSSTFVSPRAQRCRRQNRVTSADELPTDLRNYDKNNVNCIPRPQDGIIYQDFVNDSHQDLSPQKFRDSAFTSGAVSQSDVQESFTKSEEADSARFVQSEAHLQKRLSGHNTSVVNTDESKNVRNRKSWSSRKKKKEVEDNNLPNVDVNSGRVGGVCGPQENHEHPRQNGDSGSTPQPSTRASKGARRLAKRGIGMFPSSNWRRLRNTLKAANEMQSSRKQRHGLNREDSFLRKFSTRNHQNVQNANSSLDDDSRRSCRSASKLEGRFVIQHDGNFMFYWLGVVTVSVLYNLWTCIAREAFREIQQGCPACWYSFDALFDFIYICDIIVQFRTGYLDQGLMVYDSKKLRLKYAKSRVIYIDFICLLPLDFIQFFIGVHPMIRFPRFLKVYRPFRFLHMLESRTAYPNLIRVANLTHILFLGAHWFAAFYYMISEAEGFKGEWSYPKPVGEFSDVNRKYLRSLFWSTLTLTTIGDIPPPGNSNDLRMSNAAYVFVIVSYLIGVFVFATIVGQVGNVINNRNASRQEFERLLDGAKIYMQTHNVPHNLQKRVQRWYDYVWSRGRLNGCDINSLGLLPDKLKTELAIHVNLETLKKVTIFQECQPEFLHDLVLKMKAYIFTPGDLICRRGEVAREMFIIADGVVEIISESGVMLKRMGAGDFFGEIGILNLDGGINRRTADVRSVGYLELFVLSREDVLAALKDHPEAESIIRDYGQRRLREVEAHRLKVKPLKCRGSTQEPGNLAGTPQGVQNRFLQTLRSLNPAVRRQSGQPNHLGSPPFTNQTGSPTDVQRCVNQRGSPVNKHVSGLSKASCNAQSGLAVVSLDRTDFSTGTTSNRLPEDYSERRQTFAYFKTAYARFRNVFPRRRGQRRNMDISDDRKREPWEKRLLFKTADNQSASGDVSANSRSLSPGCNVRLNVEDCSENNKLVGNDSLPESDSTDNESNRKEKASLSSGVKRGSLLFPGLSEVEAGKYGQNLGRVIQRKYSEPVSYMPVCTEDLDEKCTRSGKEDVKEEEAEESSPVFHDADKMSQIWDGKAFLANEIDVPIPYANYETSEALKLSASSLNYPSSTVVAVDNKSFISNTDNTNHDNVDGSDTHSVNSNYTNWNKCGHINFQAHYHNDVSNTFDNNDVSSTFDSQFDNSRVKTTSEDRGSPFQNDSIESSPRICASPDRYSPFRQQCKSFSSSPTDTRISTLVSNKHRLHNRASSIRSHERVSTRNPTESDPNRRHSGCVFHISVTPGGPVSPSSSLLTASPSPFTLSCHCDPADNFKKFIGCHLPESIHHKLIKKNEVDPQPLTSSNPGSPAKAITYKSSSAESPQRTTTLLPNGCPQTGRSLSFPTLTEPKDDVRNSSEYGSRRPSCQIPDHFNYDDVPVCLSPKVLKLKQEESSTTKHSWNGNGGRSPAMSIIQQPTSDFSYQQLTAQINIMQGMIEKRLTLLEEAYSSTTEKLEYLATSQDLLVRLLKQQLVTSQSTNVTQPYQ